MMPAVAAETLEEMRRARTAAGGIPGLGDVGFPLVAGFGRGVSIDPSRVAFC